MRWEAARESKRVGINALHLCQPAQISTHRRRQVQDNRPAPRRPPEKINLEG